MTDLQNRRLALLNDTCQHYNTHNRAIDGGCCVYSHKFNGGCAIGRKCTEDVAERLSSKNESITSMLVRHTHIYNMLPSELKDLGIEFLHDLQRMHDVTGHWNFGGLSERGKMSYDLMVDQIKKGESYTICIP